MLELDFKFDLKAVSDTTKELMVLPGIFTRGRISALKAVGYYVQQRMKYVDTSPVLNPLTLRLRLAVDRFGNRKTWKNYKLVWKGEKGKKKRVREYRAMVTGTTSNADALARIKNAMRYEVDPEGTKVRIGAVRREKKIRSLLVYHSEQHMTPITARKRRFLFAMRIPVKKSTSVFVTPARDIIGKTENEVMPIVPQLFEEKFYLAIDRYLDAGRRTA
jgi:hypothetical protein